MLLSLENKKILPHCWDKIENILRYHPTSPYGALALCTTMHTSLVTGEAPVSPNAAALGLPSRVHSPASRVSARTNRRLSVPSKTSYYSRSSVYISCFNYTPKKMTCQEKYGLFSYIFLIFDTFSIFRYFIHAYVSENGNSTVITGSISSPNTAIMRCFTISPICAASFLISLSITKSKLICLSLSLTRKSCTV